MAVAPISTARLASSTDMMPFRQKCPPQRLRTSSAARQSIDWSSIVEKYSETEMLMFEPSATCSFRFDSSNGSRNR